MQQIKINMDLQVIGRIRIVAIFLNTTMMDSNKQLLAITINVFTESKFTVMTLDIRICKHYTKTKHKLIHLKAC